MSHRSGATSKHPQGAKVITNELEAPNIGTNKTFININGKTSKLETNENSVIQYKLNNPFNLDIGDKVTLYQAFVNEGGLNTDTVTFQEDIKTTVKFLYYMPSQLFANKPPDTAAGNSQGEAGLSITGDAATNCLTFSDYQDFACFPSQTFLLRDPAHTITAANDALNSYFSYFNNIEIPFSNVFSGDMGTPYYLFENYHKNSEFTERATTANTYIKPAYGEVVINIPAGNYEASSLAKNITEQFNGAFVADTNNSNFLTDRLYNVDSNNYAGVDTDNPFGNETGKATTRVFTQGSNDEKFSNQNNYTFKDIRNDFSAGSIFPVAPSPLLGDFFVNPDGLELWLRNTSNVQLHGEYPVNVTHYARCSLPLDGSQPVTFEANTIPAANAANPDNVPTFGYEATTDRFIQYCSNNLLLNVNAAPIEALPVLANGKKPIPNRYCGTHSFTVSYSDDKQNRFSISNLHESFKLPSITKTQDASNFSAQQATKYNAQDFQGNVAYPIEASMGLMVTNFGYEQVKLTDKYIELKKIYDDYLTNHGSGDRRTLKAEYDLNTTQFHEFFKTEREAKEAWNTTLWSRLGFSYNQFGNISNNLETIQTIKPVPAHPSGFSMTQERLDRYGVGKQKLKGIITHNDFDFSDIQACANLGGAPVQINGNNVNMFDSLSFAKANTLDLRLISTPLAFGGFTQIVGVTPDNTFSNIATSQSIDADNLPDLNAGNSYYLITSDIIKPNGLDANGDPMNLLGIMSKENSSNNTIYSVDGIPNIITEPKIVSELSIEIRNPDNSPVPDSIVGKASGFILLIEKAINPNVMETKSI
jgi:hypothetical protein